MERGARRIDELGHPFLAENRGQAVRLLRIGSLRDTPRPLERVNVEKNAVHTNRSSPNRRQLPFCEEVSLILANVLWA